MSIFTSLAKSLGLSSSKSSAAKGHVLGGSPQSASATRAHNPSNPEFSVTFNDRTLGLKVSESEDGRPQVSSVTTGAAADLAGVRVGDKIISLDGNLVPSFQDFNEIFAAMERPLVIR